jgi:hypothetical protein
MATPYEFFATSTHGRSQEDLLAELKRIYSTMTDYQADISQDPICQMWQWTLYNAYEMAVQVSLDMDRAESIIKSHYEPLYFAATCGLPAAKTKAEIEKEEEAVRNWLVEGLPWSGPAAAAVHTDLKVRIINAAVNLNAAKSSLRSTALKTWNRLMWFEIEARRLANRPEVLAHLEQVLRDKKVSSGICIHNLVETHCPICPPR